MIIQLGIETRNWVRTLDTIQTPKKIIIIGGLPFQRDGFSDSIFGWVIVDDLTELGQHAQLHIFRRVTAGPPISFNLLELEWHEAVSSRAILG